MRSSACRPFGIPVCRTNLERRANQARGARVHGLFAKSKRGKPAGEPAGEPDDETAIGEPPKRCVARRVRRGASGEVNTGEGTAANLLRGGCFVGEPVLIGLVGDEGGARAAGNGASSSRGRTVGCGAAGLSSFVRWSALRSASDLSAATWTAAVPTSLAHEPPAPPIGQAHASSC